MYIHAILYIILIAASTVYVERLSSSIDVNILNFSVTVIAWIFFNVLNIRRCRYAYKSIKNDPIIWLIISLFIAGSWIASYISTVLSAADFASAGIFLTVAICGSLHKKLYVKATMCILSLAACYYYSCKAWYQPLLYAVISGSSLYGYIFFSKQFSERNKLTAYDVLSIRFFPLLLISFTLMIWLSPSKSFHVFYDKNLVIHILLLSFFNRVLPMMCFQPAAHNLSAKQFSFLLSFAPLATYIFQGLVDHNFPVSLFIAVLLATFSLNIHLLSFKRRF